MAIVKIACHAVVNLHADRRGLASDTRVGDDAGRQAKCRSNLLSDVVFDVEQILNAQIAAETIRPDANCVGRVDDLSGDTNKVRRTTHAGRQHVVHIQTVCDRLHVQLFPRELSGGNFADDQNVPKPSQLRRHFFAQTEGKRGAVFIGGCKWHHRDRGTVGQLSIDQVSAGFCQTLAEPNVIDFRRTSFGRQPMIDLFSKILGRVVTIRDFVNQCLQTNSFELFWDRVVQLPWWLHIHGVQSWPSASQHLVKHHAKAVDVAATIHRARFATGLLGAHVSRRS